MNILLTSSRMPFALDEIRKFGRRGHRVFAADTIRTAPGSHSRWAGGHARISPPQYQPRRFIADVQRLVRDEAIDLIVPCFEEVFYLARHRDELAAPLFAPPLPVLAQLHNKASFNQLMRTLGVQAPESVIVTDGDSLAAAAASFERFVARPIWSRGAVALYTNAGPLANALQHCDCAPTRDQPWIVQEYVDGVDICTFSVAHHGKLVAHCAYEHPLEIEHRGGIVFESIDDPEALAVVQAIVGATGYHGQLGLDFRRDGNRLTVLECNPRPTAGVHLSSDQTLVNAVIAPDGLKVAPAGVRKKYTSAIMRDLVLHPRHALKDALYLFSTDTEEVYGQAGDPLPALYQVLSYAHVLIYRMRHRSGARRTSLVAAYFDGIEWNGGAIP